MTVFAKSDEAPAFNFVFRVLSPVVYLFLIASILYFFELDRYVYNFYMVSFHYIAIRLFVNIVTERRMLLDWYRQALYWICIIVLSYYSYIKIIVTKKNLLPDFSSLSNELWIIIFVFLYQMLNKLELSNESTEKRKTNYIRLKYIIFASKYGSTIKALNNSRLISLAYAILIYEDFNRPFIIRVLERLSFIVTNRPHTLGVMQVKTGKLINDEDSVHLGIGKIMEDYNQLAKNVGQDYNKNDSYTEYKLMTDLVSKYNGGAEYNQAVSELVNLIEDMFFKGSTDTLRSGLK